MVGESGSVCYLVSTVEVEIMDIDFTMVMEEVDVALRRCLNEELGADLKVKMTRKPLRGTRKAKSN